MEKIKGLHFLAAHGRPRTRREFLAGGFISFSAMTLIPTVFSFHREVLADDPCGSSTQTYIPLLVFDCAGGAALPANFLVTNQAGDLLKKYDQLGWDPKASGALDSSYGIPMAGNNVSKILEGLNASASAEARAKLRMGGFCHSAQSDANTNPLNMVGLAAKLGYKGKTFTQSTGTQNSISGGNSVVALAQESFRAFYVPSVITLNEAVGVAADSALGALNKNQITQIFKSGKELSSLQLQALQGSASGKLLSTLTNCSYDENEKKFSSGVGLDPRLDPIFQQVYAINAQSQPTLEGVVAAGIVKCVLEGTTGPGVITIGNCDYHNSTSTLGDSKDREIGVHIGRAVEAAHRLKKPLFFQLITDGGCSNQVGTRIWVSDANEKCMTVVGYYNPTATPTQRRVQVGYYTEGQGAAKEALTGLGENPRKVAASCFANYLSLHVAASALSGEFFKYVPSDLFSGSPELEQALIFGA